MPSKKGAKLKSFILCEEIRKEDNGKLIFIGVYPENVLAYKFPAKLKFAIWISGETTAISNKIELDIAAEPLDDGDKIPIARAEMDMPISEDKLVSGTTDFNLWLEGLIVGFEKESRLIIRAREKGGRWKPIGTKLILSHPGHASENEQPS